MATRADYRDDLENKLVGLESEGYGDFEFTQTELDTYLELAAARLYPAVYKRVSLDAQSVTEYGNREQGYVDVDHADRVFLVEDTTELEAIADWKIRPGRIVNIDTSVDDWNEVNIYYHDAYTMPSDDATEVGIPDRFAPLLILGALIEALESRHDTGLRGDPQPHGYHPEAQLLQRLERRYLRLRDEMAMDLPGVVL